MINKKNLKLIFGLLFAAFFLYFFVRQIDIEKMEKAFSTASLMWIISGIIAFCIGFVFRIERWRIMLSSERPSIKWRTCAGPFVSGFAANNIMPFRIGDLIRTFLFCSHLGVSSGIVLATLFIERLLDLLAILTFFSFVVYRTQGIDTVLGVSSIFVFFVALLILIVLLFPKIYVPLALRVRNLIIRIFPTKGAQISEEILNFISTLEKLSYKSTMPRLIAWSFLAWLVEGCVFWFSALALPSINNSLSGWVAFPVGTLSTLIPSTPGYVGTFDFFTAKTIALFGNGPGVAAAYAILVHLMIWLPPTLVGGIYILFRPLNLKNLESRSL